MTAEARNLVEAIHSRAVLNVSNMLHEDQYLLEGNHQNRIYPPILNRARQNLEGGEVCEKLT